MLLATILVASKGIQNEWLYGCGNLVRPLGHAGIFSGLVISGILDFKPGLIFTMSMTLLLSLHFIESNIYHIIFRTSCFWMLTYCFDFNSLVLIFSFYNTLIFEKVNFEDVFANYGHISLFASCVSSKSLSSYLLGFCICFFFIILNNDEISALSLLVSFVISLSKYDNKNTVLIPWKNRPLWKCENGIVSTIVFSAYALFLLLDNFMNSCEESSHALYSIHVGGILSVCVLIYPQVSPRVFHPFKAIISLAALFDASLSLLILKNGSKDIYLMFRSLFAFLSCLAALLLKKPDDSHVIISEVVSHSINYTRVSCVFFYIVSSFIQSVNETSIVYSFGKITHLCLIIGGIALEAVVWNDNLMTNIARLLGAFELISSIYDGESIIYIFKSLLLIFCLPLETQSIRNVLSV